MKGLTLFLKIANVASGLFDKKTGEELQRIRDHFEVAYSEAQLCALVMVGMVLRVFKIIPEPAGGTRSMWFVVGMLIKFLRSTSFDGFRSGPNPLDELVDEGMQQLEA